MTRNEPSHSFGDSSIRTRGARCFAAKPCESTSRLAARATARAFTNRHATRASMSATATFTTASKTG